ncbi:hypothetical protein OHT76_40480 [Streptomyces sp. NBC_00287]|uniref:hypothetical protein n=1 Tax=Streptomyces sp. NBC_00287 TaxID=2975702 RepID=UPI002E2D4599|nr:hypothetical protein [Streptomyces sp. NBC_00287]
MGRDLTVLAVDWGQLERTPPDERAELLYEAACPDDHAVQAAQPDVGWVFPASPQVPWCGRYEFQDTLGSYKPHFWAAESWDTVRQYADPALREPLDGFLAGLIRWGADPEAADDDLEPGLFPADPEPWRPPTSTLVCPPASLPALTVHWALAEPLLGELREIYDSRAARPGRWIAGFDEFADLMRQWAFVVGEAEQRGWGLLGLPV